MQKVKAALTIDQMQICNIQSTKIKLKIIFGENKMHHIFLVNYQIVNFLVNSFAFSTLQK